MSNDYIDDDATQAYDDDPYYVDDEAGSYLGLIAFIAVMVVLAVGAALAPVWLVWVSQQ